MAGGEGGREDGGVQVESGGQEPLTPSSAFLPTQPTGSRKMSVTDSPASLQRKYSLKDIKMK